MKKITALIFTILPVLAHGATDEEVRKIRYESGSETAYIWHEENQTKSSDDPDLLLEYYIALAKTTRCQTALKISKKIDPERTEIKQKIRDVWEETCSFLPKETFTVTGLLSTSDSSIEPTPWNTSQQPPQEETHLNVHHKIQIPWKQKAFTIQSIGSKSNELEAFQTRFGLNNRTNQGRFGYGIWMSLTNSNFSKGFWVAYEKKIHNFHHIYAEFNHFQKCKNKFNSYLVHSYIPRIGRLWASKLWTDGEDKNRFEFAHERQDTFAHKTKYSLRWNDDNSTKRMSAHVQYEYHLKEHNIWPFAALSHRLSKNQKGFEPNISFGIKTNF